MKRIIPGVLFITCVMFIGCSTSPICVTDSVTPLQGKTITEKLGQCSGSDTAWSFLGLYMFGRPDIDEAIKEAVASKGADTIINVRCYEKWGYFLFFSTSTVIVEGEAVKLGSPETEKKVKGK